MNRKIIVGALAVLLGLPLLALLLALTLFSHSTATSLAAVSVPPAASVSSKVIVPTSMRSGTFASDRYLNLPPNFSISVYTRISSARFMAVTPDGNLLVSQPSTGKVLLVRPNPSNDPLVSDFATGLNNPHDLVFHSIGATTYLYVSESSQINRFTYTAGNLTAQNRQVIISGLPDNSTPELRGIYAHALKNIALDANDKLYVSIASTCNACTGDTTSNPVRGAIYQYNADGTGGRLFARGLRNAEGLAMIPGTSTLWVAVNNRDNIACPSASAGSGCGSAGQVVQSYVDNHPPEEFTQVRDGGNYGWPFCNPNPDTANGMDNMPFDRDYEYNADGSRLDCNGADRINKGIQAHSAPLGLLFLQNTNFAAPYRNGAVIGLHGSWNRATPTGYKVIYFPWDTTTQTPGGQQDLVSGWLNGGVWGRPVDAAVDQAGNMFISDDYSGTVYKLSYSIPVNNSVTQDTDSGSATEKTTEGYLSYALMQPNSTITFNVPGNVINVTGKLPPVSAGVTLDGGSCTNGQPGITIKASNVTGDGLVLGGSNFIMNVKITGFTGRQIFVASNKTGTKIGKCVVVKR